MAALVIGAGLVLGLLRVWIGFTCEPEPITLVACFKDAAHLFMGGLIVACRVFRRPWMDQLFWGMCALEVAVAVYQRM